MGAGESAAGPVNDGDPARPVTGRPDEDDQTAADPGHSPSDSARSVSNEESLPTEVALDQAAAAATLLDPFGSSEGAAAPDALPTSDEAEGTKLVAVRWNLWALGVEHEGKWQLFQLVGGAWRHRGVLHTRKGRQHELLEALAKGEGEFLEGEVDKIDRHRETFRVK
jgi:hypothetical protein